MSWRDGVVPGVLALLAALLVVGIGLIQAHGDVSRFVDAGSRFVTPRPHLAVRPGAGYDGQFVYRLALAPLDLARSAHGITLDLPFRRQRIGLPLLGWLASAGGRPALLPGALVTVNVLAFTAIGALGGVIGRQAGRAPAWGLLLASPVGLSFALTRDLTEVLEVALLVGGIVAVGAGRPVTAGLLLAGGALTRETALLVVAAIALPRLTVAARDHSARPVRADAAWLLPVGAFVVWQAAVSALTGELALRSDGGTNLGPPFGGVVGLLRDLPSASSHEWPPLAAQAVLLGCLVLVAVPHLRAAPRPLPTAWALTGAFSLCLGTVVWTGYDDLRFLVELSVLTILVLLASPRRLGDVAAGSAAVWVLTLVLHLG